MCQKCTNFFTEFNLLLLNYISIDMILRIPIIVLIFLVSKLAVAQKIFSVDYASQADIKVFVVDYQNQADLCVYKVNYESQTKGNQGLWYFVDYKSQSDKTIFFVDYKNQADLLIYFVDYQNQAKWNKKSKIHLLH